MSKFEIGSVWKTRGGWKAVVVDVRPITKDANLTMTVWHLESTRGHTTSAHPVSGVYLPGEEKAWDLIEPWKEPIVHEGWVRINKYDSRGMDTAGFHEEKPNTSEWSSAIACIKIKFTEGDGL